MASTTATKRKGRSKKEVEEVLQQETAEQVQTVAAAQQATPVATTTATTKKADEKEVDALTEECFHEIRKHFATVFTPPGTTKEFWFVDILPNQFDFLAKAVGRSLNVADVFGPVVQMGKEVVSAVPTIKGGKKVFPPIVEFSCVLLDIRNFDNWPKLNGDVVTTEYITQIAQKWDDGTVRRLGRYIPTKKGPLPFYGRIFAPDTWTSPEDIDPRDWKGGWRFSDHVRSPLGQAVIKLQKKFRDWDFIPMPESDVPKYLDVLKARAANTKEKKQAEYSALKSVAAELDDLLGFDEEEEEELVSPQRGAKRTFQGSRGR